MNFYNFFLENSLIAYIFAPIFGELGQRRQRNWASPIQHLATQPCQVRKEAASSPLKCVI
jgi:hypothetical protein